MPQLATLGVAEAKAGTWAIGAGGGFGLIASQNGEGGHQRVQGSLAGAYTLTEGVALGLRFDGRYDAHPDDAQGSDDSLVGTPTLRARLATGLSDSLRLGLDLGLTVPGKNAPSLAFDALRLDLRAMVTYFGASSWGFTSSLGARIDESGKAAPDLATTRPGDRVSLGLNDFHALLLGIGAWKRFSRVEMLGEVTWNPWLGNGAPSAMQSPLHAVVGARYLTSDSVALELLLDGLLSKRPETAGNKLAAIDPSFAILLGVRLMGGYAPAPAVAVETPQPPPPPVETSQPVAAMTTPVRGRVVDNTGTPVADAEVTIVRDGFEQSTRSAPDGSYAIENVPLGPATLRVQGRRLKPTERPLDVTTNAAPVDVQPERLPPEGQLRGLVRSYDGKPLAATITVDPSGQTFTASAEGEFELGLAPGEYQIRISIHGYGAQSRTVQIEDDGVTLLNVDLKKARR